MAQADQYEPCPARMLCSTHARATFLHMLFTLQWGNSEFQCYTSDSSNAAIIPNPDKPSDGVLRITSRHVSTPQTCTNRQSAPSQKSWTSAKLVTKNLHSFAPKSGPSGCQPIVVESRLKVPWKQGHWAAFWMLPQDSGAGWPKSGEIDIMEHINLAQEVLGTVHLGNAEGELGFLQYMVQGLHGCAPPCPAESHDTLLAPVPHSICWLNSGRLLLQHGVCSVC